MLSDQMGKRDIEELQAELESLRADKERLDWIGANDAGVFPPFEFPGKGWGVEPADSKDSFFAPTLREAIDAARKADPTL